MDTSPTTESKMLLKPEINLRKYKHPCQVGDLNPSEEQTQLAEVWSIRGY
jgi:hypothetical protein